MATIVQFSTSCDQYFSNQVSKKSYFGVVGMSSISIFESIGEKEKVLESLDLDRFNSFSLNVSAAKARTHGKVQLKKKEKRRLNC